MKITRKLIITNTMWSAVAQVVVMLVNLLIVPLFIKNMGSDLYGIWIISAAILGYVNIFDFGFTQGLQKYVAEARDKECVKELSEVIVSGLVLLCGIGLLLGYIFYIWSHTIVAFFNIQPENRLIAEGLLKISAIFCTVLWPLKIVDVVLNASMRIKELSFLNATKAGVQSIALIGMLYMSANILLIKWVTMILLTIVSSYGVILLWKYVPEIKWNLMNFRVYHIRRMHRFSLGMFYVAALGLLAVKIDKLIIGRMLNMQAVAVYVIISKLFLLIQQVTRMLMVALVPAVYNMSVSVDLKRIDRLVNKAVKYRMLITGAMAYVCILISPDFIRLWVGAEYVQYARWSQLLCVVPLFVGLGVGNGVARAMGYVKEVNAVYTVQIILNLVLSIALVRYLGVGGPVLGTVIAVILVGDFSMFPYFCRVIGIPWKKTFFMALLINAVGGVVFLFGMILYRVMIPVGWLSLGVYMGVMSAGYAVVFGLLFLREEIKELRTWYTSHMRRWC